MYLTVCPLADAEGACEKSDNNLMYQPLPFLLHSLIRGRQIRDNRVKEIWYVCLRQDKEAAPALQHDLEDASQTNIVAKEQC